MDSQRKSDRAAKLARRYHFDLIDSTNSWAKNHPEWWSPQGVTLVSAGSQRKGRGRWSHHWFSPFGVNIYASFCFWSHSSLEEIGRICPLLACSAVRFLHTLDFFPLIKWPNDLLLQGKKVGGILCETFERGTARGVVCGIGLNVNMPLNFMEQIERPATSLFLESGQVFDLEALLSSLSSHFLEDLALFFREGFAPFFTDWEEKSAHKVGDLIRFSTSSGVVEGFFSQFMPNGNLEIVLKEGWVKQFSSFEFL